MLLSASGTFLVFTVISMSLFIFFSSLCGIVTVKDSSGLAFSILTTSFLEPFKALDMLSFVTTTFPTDTPSTSGTATFTTILRPWLAITASTVGFSI